jgi:hypothetical protein
MSAQVNMENPKRNIWRMLFLTLSLCNVVAIGVWVAIRLTAAPQPISRNYEMFGMKNYGFSINVPGKGKVNHGSWYGTYSDGTPRYQYQYKEGQLDGTCIWFHASGFPKEIVQYNAGVFHGTYMQFDIYGRLTQLGKCNNGALIEHHIYNPTGIPTDRWPLEWGRIAEAEIRRNIAAATRVAP